jgi:hypothetical protein
LGMKYGGFVKLLLARFCNGVEYVVGNLLQVCNRRTLYPCKVAGTGEAHNLCFSNLRLLPARSKAGNRCDPGAFLCCCVQVLQRELQCEVWWFRIAVASISLRRCTVHALQSVARSQSTHFTPSQSRRHPNHASGGYIQAQSCVVSLKFSQALHVARRCCVHDGHSFCCRNCKRLCAR